MRTYRVKRFAGMLLTVALTSAPAAAPAQFEMLGAMPDGQQLRPTVAGMGTTTLLRPPDAIRMHIELTAKAATLDEALAQLRTRREAALLQLEMLKADMDSVQTGAPTVSSGQSEQRRQMEQMILHRMRGRGQRLPAGFTVGPELVAVSMTLRAEWPLAADTPEEALRRTEAIRAQVKEADLAGRAEEPELSPEAQELAEEMAGMRHDYDDSPVPEGEPLFLFLARVSDADQEEFTAEAYARARRQAQSLARAAGMNLGPLVSLAGQSGGQSSMMEGHYGYEYHAWMRRVLGPAGMDMTLNQDTTEALSATAEPLSFNFVVRASFALAPPE